MIPDFQTLMRPVLEAAAQGERSIADVVAEMSDVFDLAEEERRELLPSGRQARMANRVHWARSYLKQAGLLRATRRGHFAITEQGRQVLSDAPARIDMAYLERFPEYIEFKSRSRAGAETQETRHSAGTAETQDATPDEVIRAAYAELRAALAEDLIDRLRTSPPAFFERVIVDLLLRMGYGATQDAGAVLGQSGDGGVDGVIDKDPLGVDQVYVQAKRYAEGNVVGPGAIRDFFGALSLKSVSSGIFVTTAQFTQAASHTADRLGARIVLIDGPRLANLMIDYQVGCRVRDEIRISEVDEAYFE